MGFSADGRLRCPVDFDGRALGEHFGLLRPPMAEINAPGGLMIGLADMGHACQHDAINCIVQTHRAHGAEIRV